MEKNNLHVIRIIGIVGSGKTYIADKLKKKLNKDILICDIDDYYINIIKSYGKDKIPPVDKLNLLVNNLLSSDIKKHNPRILIIIGTSTHEGGHNYFLKVDNIENVYRRFMEREYKKINDNEKLINSIIKKIKNPDDITRAIDENIISAHHYDFNEYKKMYDDLYKNCKSRNFHICTQEEIYDDILKFCTTVSGANEKYIKKCAKLRRSSSYI